MTLRRPEVSLYKRNSAYITEVNVLHKLEKEAEIDALPRFKRKKLAVELYERWKHEEQHARQEARLLIEELRDATDALGDSFQRLAELNLPELRGKVDAQRHRIKQARAHVTSALSSLDEGDFGKAGGAVNEAGHELWLIGGRLVVALNQGLSQAALSKEFRRKLEQNFAERQQAKSELKSIRKNEGPIAGLRAACRVHLIEAEGYNLAAEVLGSQVRKERKTVVKVGREGSLRVVQPQELETFSDVGGLDVVKEELRATIGAILENPDEAARYDVVHNGILFHGPPGTGKTLLSRALAGEYGLRYIRFSPASIASAYIHEAAANLQRIFELAQESSPCVLFLDEVDTIASARDEQPSADHREVVTQLMNSLEEYRSVPGLVIVAATNNIDRLDPGLREGRFDSKILIPLPDQEARKEILRIHLARRDEAVEWAGMDLDELARQTHGRNAAALESFVSLAAQKALKAGESITHALLSGAVRDREGKDRVSLDEPVRWDDVVLQEDTREQLIDILNVFGHPETARALGVKPPAGILLYGPPGTGKTTIAKAMATELSASFYEQSAADLLSKWAGESEERVAKLFVKARANRPSIIFIDEIDGLVRRRSGDSSTPWEERVVSQFLRELDGLVASEGVLLVGATNRIDIIDPAIQGRRLTPVEIGLPDAPARLMLLEIHCRDMALAEDVDLRRLAQQTEGMSGADIKRLRDVAGMRALSRATRNGGSHGAVVTMAEFETALDMQRDRASLVRI